MRKYLLKVVDIFITFLHIYCIPKKLDPSDEFRFSSWLDFTSYVFFQFMPQIFYRVEIGGFRGSFPPSYSFLFKKFVLQFLMYV